LRKDTTRPGDLYIGDYLEPNRTQLIRTMPIDCPVGTSSNRCADLFGGTGGYTYGDFSGVIGSAEVHASGEIWGQTLWDLRTRLGHTVTDAIVTRAMSLAPDDPSFLDMRNSILQADKAVYGGDHRTAVWRIFANRGMGFNAGTLDGTDAFPAEDFSMPPPPQTPRASVSGQVTDALTGDPIAGALVAIGGHDSGFTGDYTDVTDASGRYTIPNVFVGSYPLLSVFGPGYEIISTDVDVTPDGTTADFTPRRDWAASSGGGLVTDFDGPDFTFVGCGPNNVNDVSQGTAWVTLTGDVEAPADTIVPKSIVIKLPQPISLRWTRRPTAASAAARRRATSRSRRRRTEPTTPRWRRAPTHRRTDSSTTTSHSTARSPTSSTCDSPSSRPRCRRRSRTTVRPIRPRCTRGARTWC
jgi:hypothetical protein